MAGENPFLIYGRYGALGFEFAGAVVAGLLLGHYADIRFDTAPLLMIVGVVAGLAGAVTRLVVVLQRLTPREHRTRPDRCH